MLGARTWAGKGSNSNGACVVQKSVKSKSLTCGVCLQTSILLDPPLKQSICVARVQIRSLWPASGLATAGSREHGLCSQTAIPLTHQPVGPGSCRASFSEDVGLSSQMSGTNARSVLKWTMCRGKYQISCRLREARLGFGDSAIRKPLAGMLLW